VGWLSLEPRECPGLVLYSTVPSFFLLESNVLTGLIGSSAGGHDVVAGFRCQGNRESMILVDTNTRAQSLYYCSHFHIGRPYNRKK
jgi:hypothetical protein